MKARNTFRARRLAHIVLPALLMLLGGSPASTNTPVVPVPSAPAPVAAVEPTPDSVTMLRKEVRLRKLHMVRPDLIQYPLMYDVYC